MNPSKDEQYMRRCLQLAACGRQNAKPNPMVGAVIVAQDRIIGEGYHVRCGEGHAEVNAFASVRPEDQHLLPEATIYVSLEPCAHYGKTPPCADLIISRHVRRVVVGCVDPFSRVQGRGIERIHQAGISVTVGVLEQECLDLNRRFITVNTHQRPYILLKWAQSANAYIDSHHTPIALSTPYTQMLVHKLRSEYDAILVGHRTFLNDHPRLDTRLWTGPAPLRILLTNKKDKQQESNQRPENWLCCHSIDEVLEVLTQRHLQALMVEGGANVLQQFIDRGLWDEIRRETSPVCIAEGTPAPALPKNIKMEKREYIDGNIIEWMRKEKEKEKEKEKGSE